MWFITSEDLLKITAPIDLYDLNKVPHSGNTVMPVQKELFESVHANLSILEAWLSARVDLQNSVEQLLIGRGMIKGVDYDRETGRVKVSIKECVPDFVLLKLSLAVEVKLARTETKAKAIVDEINADIQAYGREYERLLFIVYDLGTIRDTLEFTKGLEVTPGTEVIVVKH